MLHPRDFETVTAGMFERLGFKVKQTPFVKDGAVDAFLWKDGKQFLLECKRYSDGVLVGQRDTRMLHSAINENNANGGYFVTTGRFTKDALRFASSVGITPVDQDALLRLMFESVPTAANDVSYRSMCRQCGSTVRHNLRDPRAQQCANGHRVAPTLDTPSVILAAARHEFVHPTTVPHARKAIVGNSYPVRNELRALGGRWSSAQKAWLLPYGKAEEAKWLVANAPRNLPQPEGKPISGSPLPPEEDVDEGVGSDTISVVSELDALLEKDENNQQGIRAGDRISIRCLDEGKTDNYTLSGSRNDPANGILSVLSPLGRQLLGLDEGDETAIDIASKQRRVRIVAVNNDSTEVSNKAVTEAPSIVGDLWQRAFDFLSKADYDDAIAVYDEAIGHDPSNPDLFDARGDICRRKGDYPSAILNYNEAIRLNPKEASFFIARATVYDVTGEYGQAIADYSEAIKLDPTDEEFFNWRGDAHQAKGEYDQAIADYDMAISLVPHDAYAFFKRAEAFEKNGQFGNAIADYSEAIRFDDPANVLPHYRRGLLYSALGQQERAISDYNEAMQLDPDGLYDRAVADYHKTVSLDQRYAKAFRQPNIIAARNELAAQAASRKNSGAPDHENGSALCNAGWIGLGLPQDATEAAKWVMTAAKQGDPDAQTKLGYAYANGRGVRQNYVEAARWYQLAAWQGYARARSALYSIHQYMTGAQIGEGQRRALEWKVRVRPATRDAAG